jgi:transmembrane sensor
MMASEAHQDVLDEAIAWHLRMQNAKDEDWDAFVAWLEEDPARSDAYDRVEASHVEMTAEAFPLAPAPLPVVANDDAPPRRRLWPWATGFAVIAAILLVAFVTPMKSPPGPASSAASPSPTAAPPC